MNHQDSSKQNPSIGTALNSDHESEKRKEEKPCNAEISYFDNHRETTPSKSFSIRLFLSLIQSSLFWKEKIECIRDKIDEGDGNKAKTLKASLPVVSISGMVTEGPRAGAHKDGRFQHSGYLQGDFDAKDFHPRKADHIKEVLASDEHVQGVFLSPTRGVKAIIRIPVCETPEQHKSAFLAAEKYFHTKYGLTLDSSTKDPVRLCYVSYDPHPFIKKEPATIIAVRQTADSPVSRESSGKAEKKEYAKLSLEEIKTMLNHIPTRPDYDEWIKISSAVWAATGDEETGTKLLKEWSPEEEPGEYSEKYKSRLQQITPGTLVFLAKKNGYQTHAKGMGRYDISVPENVFPIPAGEVEYSRTGNIIFSVIGPTHTLFNRGGRVHEINDTGKEPAYLAPLSSQRFCSLVENYDHRLARREFQTVEGSDNKGKIVWRTTRLSNNASKILLCSDAARENLPPIHQLVACPILTKEGNVLGRGYHDHSGGTYITEGKTPQKIPIDEAVPTILGLFDDFRFVTPSDKSRAVASILSPALKMGGWIEDDFPMDVAEADQSQSGKTYRQKLINRIYNETPSSVTEPRRGVGSLDEAIASALIKGRPFIMLDNFRGKLDSTILEQAIRGARRVTCRALRISADIDASPFIWQLSTNGADFTRDIANRSIITRIRKQERGYSFKEYPEGDLLSHAGAKNSFYLGAVFSVIKEWARMGCQKTDENRHDFRGWCRSLDWIILHIFGLPPLLDGHLEEQARAANPALQWLRDVAIATRDTNHLNRSLSASELVSIAEDAGIDFPGNRFSREEPHQRAGKILGKLFRETEKQEVIVDGLTVTRKEKHVTIPGRGSELRKFYLIEVEK